LASGFLSGKYRSESDVEKKTSRPMLKKYFNERGFKILEALDQVAKNIKPRLQGSLWRGCLRVPASPRHRQRHER